MIITLFFRWWKLSGIVLVFINYGHLNSKGESQFWIEKYSTVLYFISKLLQVQREDLREDEEGVQLRAGVPPHLREDQQVGKILNLVNPIMLRLFYLVTNNYFYK